MAVEFNNSGTKYIKWTAPTGVVGLTAKTILISYVPASSPAGGEYLFMIYDGAGLDSDEYNYVYHASSAAKIGCLFHFSTTDGIWQTTNNVLTVPGFNQIVITYDGSSTSNDPIIYINGVSVAITEGSTPAGTYRSGTSTDLYIGTPVVTINPNGKILATNIFNRIASASEIADWYASKLAIPDKRGLVFAPQLWGNAGNVGEGGTLAAGNTVADAVSGSLGVCSGSPIFRGDQYLTFQN